MAKKEEQKTLDDYYHFTVRWDRSLHFFQENPDLQYIHPYSELIENTTLKKAAKIMDAIWMAYDAKSASQNSKSRSEKEIQHEVARYFLKDELFPWKDYQEVIDAYKKHSRTAIENDVFFHRDQLDQLKEYLSKLPMNTGATEKVALMKDYKALVEDCAKLEALASSERKEKRMRAGIRRSMVEKLIE